MTLEDQCLKLYPHEKNLVWWFGDLQNMLNSEIASMKLFTSEPYLIFFQSMLNLKSQAIIFVRAVPCMYFVQRGYHIFVIFSSGIC